MLADLKANLARAAAHSQAVDKIQQDRDLAVEALRRGYGFIGAHYLDWLHSGEKLLQQSLLARLNLEAADTSTMTVEAFGMTVEAFGGPLLADSIPTEPQFRTLSTSSLRACSS